MLLLLILVGLIVMLLWWWRCSMVSSMSRSWSNILPWLCRSSGVVYCKWSMMVVALLMTLNRMLSRCRCCSRPTTHATTARLMSRCGWWLAAMNCSKCLSQQSLELLLAQSCSCCKASSKLCRSI